MLTRAFSLLAFVVLADCGANGKFASDAEVARAHYVSTDPPSITLITSINNRSNTGAHTALILNGAERVLFDPAGSWDQPAAPERNDLRYGMSVDLDEPDDNLQAKALTGGQASGEVDLGSGTAAFTATVTGIRRAE